jgi:hypothetical protein
MSQLSDEEITTSIRQIEEIINYGNRKAIQKLTMMKAGDERIIHELQSISKQYKWLVVWGWVMTGVALGLVYLT